MGQRGQPQLIISCCGMCLISTRILVNAELRAFTPIEIGAAQPQKYMTQTLFPRKNWDCIILHSREICTVRGPIYFSHHLCTFRFTYLQFTQPSVEDCIPSCETPTSRPPDCLIFGGKSQFFCGSAELSFFHGTVFPWECKPTQFSW
jgi:hypothetical protein